MLAENDNANQSRMAEMRSGLVLYRFGRPEPGRFTLVRAVYGDRGWGDFKAQAMQPHPLSPGFQSVTEPPAPVRKGSHLRLVQ